MHFSFSLWIREGVHSLLCSTESRNSHHSSLYQSPTGKLKWSQDFVSFLLSKFCNTQITNYFRLEQWPTSFQTQSDHRSTPTIWVAFKLLRISEETNVPDLTLRASEKQIKVSFQVYRFYCKNWVSFSLQPLCATIKRESKAERVACAALFFDVSLVSF